MIHGAFCCAVLNKSRTLDAPTPTNISTKSEPDNEKNGTLASPATALAKSVFPVPGGPTRSAPFGSFAPICTYFCGLCKKSTISVNDSFASSSSHISKCYTSCTTHISCCVCLSNAHHAAGTSSDTAHKKSHQNPDQCKWKNIH